MKQWQKVWKVKEEGFDKQYEYNVEGTYGIIVTVLRYRQVQIFEGVSLWCNG